MAFRLFIPLLLIFSVFLYLAYLNPGSVDFIYVPGTPVSIPVTALAMLAFVAGAAAMFILYSFKFFGDYLSSLQVRYDLFRKSRVEKRLRKARRLAEKGLKPNGPATRPEWIRRAYYDLIGLPPTPKEVEDFEKDTLPGSYEKVIDRLLTLPQYGEKNVGHLIELLGRVDTLEEVILPEITNIRESKDAGYEMIGADGFGYVHEPNGQYKIPQTGNVVIGNEVEIGSCATIDRATVGSTLIENGCKIDNLVQIGHNVQLGIGCVIVSHVGISGSTKLGNYVVLGGQEVLQKIATTFIKNPQIVISVLHQEALPAQSFMGKVCNASDKFWTESRIYVNKGDHIHNLQGSATVIRKELTQKIRYPSAINTDSAYLYLKAKELGQFEYMYHAKILYRTPETISDFWSLSSRAIFHRHQTLAKYFGNMIKEQHKIPIKYKIKAIIKMLSINPIYTSLALVFNGAVRIFPRKDKGVVSKTWQMNSSSRRPAKLLLT